MSCAVGRRAKLLLYLLVTHTSGGLTDRSKPQACWQVGLACPPTRAMVEA